MKNVSEILSHLKRKEVHFEVDWAENFDLLIDAVADLSTVRTKDLY